jgi:hypothetical protein
MGNHPVGLSRTVNRKSEPMKHASHPTGLPLQPEQVFFKDPAIDRLLAMVMSLAAELHVTKDRLATLEMTLEKSGTLASGALDGFVPNAEQADRLKAERESFAHVLMQCTLGREVSLGAPEDVVERFNKD